MNNLYVSFQLPEWLLNRLIILNVSECTTIQLSPCTSIQRPWILLAIQKARCLEFYGIGHSPNCQLLEGQVELDSSGYVLVEEGSFLSVYKERIKSSNISSIRFLSQTELLWNPESNSCTTTGRLLIYIFYTITSLENMKSENAITHFVKSVTSVAAVILKMHPMSYDLKMLSCTFSTVLKIQFLQNSKPNANFFHLHLKLLFFSTKSQGQRSSDDKQIHLIIFII